MWKKININKNQIEIELTRAALINCPHNSCYNGFSFWHPLKLIREGETSNSVSLSYTNEFNFRLINYSKNKHKKAEIVDEVTIGADEFEEMFKITNDNISSSKDDTICYLKILEPTKIDIENVEVPKCLQNNN